LVVEQLRDINILPSSVILEPVSKNTAPALTLAALNELERGDDPVLVVMPADQVIEEHHLFIDAIKNALELAKNGSIVTLGVPPTLPNTGYGYIRVKKNQSTGAMNFFDVVDFFEKPDIKKAQSYLNEGNFFWNAGIFILKASTWVEIFSHFHPEVINGIEFSWKNKNCDGIFLRPEEESFSMIVGESIDYAVMQQCSKSKYKAQLVKLEAGWKDVGVWDSIWDLSPKDKNGNTTAGDVLLVDSKNSLIRSTNRLVTAIGVKNLAIIETTDAVLIADMSRVQEVKQLVERLTEENRKECLLPSKVYRPWGWYESIEVGSGYQVKRIHVKPGGSLSLQKHVFRSEHWVVVGGVAQVTLNQDIFELSKNQSIFIPAGSEHRLRNLGSIGLDLIEVQSGDYLGEDDIVRLSDEYGRGNKQ
jgi:mannose-1-phosphate guanylyltransferase/mannose-6-phosphate isomerase